MSQLSLYVHFYIQWNEALIEGDIQHSVGVDLWQKFKLLIWCNFQSTELRYVYEVKCRLHMWFHIFFKIPGCRPDFAWHPYRMV